MATSSYDSIFAYGTTQLAVPAGASAAILVKPWANQVNMLVKYISGGTLIDIVGVPYGSTLTGAQLAAQQNKAFRLDASPTGQFEVKGPAAFYLMCQGATGVFSLTVGQSQGDAVPSYQN